MRNVARIKLGYYPLPLEEGKRLRKLLDFSAGNAIVVDPCAGTGAALHQLTEGAETEKHGIELDANRAAMAAASGITTIQGDLFNPRGYRELRSKAEMRKLLDRKIVDKTDVAPSVTWRSPTIATLCRTTLIQEEWEGRGETTIRRISRRCTSGATARRDPRGSISDRRSAI